MNQKHSIRMEGQNMVFVLIPQKEYDVLTQTQQRILQLLEGENRSLPGIGDFIPKEEAERIIGRKGTTLWKLRRTRKIKSAKIGSEVFYSKQSILDYLTKNLK